jgi:DNA-binding NtrC family response regulator
MLSYSKPTVLIVDDSPEMLRYLRLLLLLDGYEVETAVNGRDAVERVQRGCAARVVLLDLQMPEMDGMKTLKHLRRLNPGLHVIMCSGVSDGRMVDKAAALGARAYLTKPVQHLYLSAALEHCLGFMKNTHDAYNCTGSLVMFPAVQGGVT